MASITPINIATDTPSSAATKTNANELAINTEVIVNNAKVTNATHTGEVTGSGVLTVDSTAISNKTLKSTPTGTEEVLINDGGTLKKTTTQGIADLGGGGGNAISLYTLAGGTTVSGNTVFGIITDYDGITTTNTSGVITITAGTYLIEITAHAWDSVNNIVQIRIDSSEIDRFEVSSDSSDPSSAAASYSFVTTQASEFDFDLRNPSPNPATYESNSSSNTTQGVIIKITKLP